jgi:hypothetical protein
MKSADFLRDDEESKLLSCMWLYNQQWLIRVTSAPGTAHEHTPQGHAPRGHSR